ncbi:MAG TPA: MMPL family transporter [Patescibacteria group bacterium]|nr:MMPL family transporter [Patescibacteria group bacterium]
MLARLAVALVHWCWRHAVTVVVTAVLLTGLLGNYAANHLGLDTDESKMLSAALPFRRAEQQMDRAFPQDVDLLVVVLDGPSPDQTDQAAARLYDALAGRKDLFRSLRRPAEELYFRKNGLLFLSLDELTELSDRLVAAQPLLGSLARDPSLRGLLSSITLALEGVSRRQISLNDLEPMLQRLDGVAAPIAAGRTAEPLSWPTLFGGMAEQDSARRFLLAQPILQYGELVAGRAAADAIHHAADGLGLTEENGYRLRLTGSVALADANFATVAEGVEVSAPLSVAAVCLLLFLALRSVRMVGAVLLSLVVGLITTAAFAAVSVGTLNPISVAFAVLFVGIAVDFGIQFVVRFRDERFHWTNPETAMLACARAMVVPLSLAAATTATGFLSFLPTAYSGVSQLGLIAGAGMLIALLVDFTLLPALLALLQPRPEKEPVGLPLAAADRWLARHCGAIIAVSLVLGTVGAALLPRVPFDANPLHLQSPKAEAVSTFFDLARDPDNGSYAIDVLTPSTEAAARLAERLDASPLVRRSMTIDSFIPDQQAEKLEMLSDLDHLLAPTLSPPALLPAPAPAETMAILRSTADRLAELSPLDTPARAMAGHLRDIAERGPNAVQALQTALLSGLPGQLADLRRMLAVSPLSLADLPPDLRRNWLAADGRARVQVLPKGDMDDQASLIAFVKAVRAIAPNANGMPVSIEQSAKVVTNAFARAGVSALAAIAILLGLALRRIIDVLLVLLPLVMAALFMAVGIVWSGLTINFANIIALPLVLGIGVAFNVYFVVNWRNGVTGHLQSATTRAVLFSALTTGSAFGSLALSPHLGTASIGLLLFLSLGMSVATTFFLLPALFCALARWRE